ncbi:MAG: peptidase MA family metallohydrolase [Thermomicrobiales bacterium]
MRFACLGLIVAMVLPLLQPTSAAADQPPVNPFAQTSPGGDIPGFALAETDHFRFYLQGTDGPAASVFAVAYGDAAERGLSELSSVYGIEWPDKIDVFVYTNETDYKVAVGATGRQEISGIDAIADPKNGQISILLANISAQTAQEADNSLRHAISHLLTGYASGGMIPSGIDEGLAMYMERPVNPKLARIAGIMQTAVQRGELLSWSDLNRSRPPATDPKLLSAESYAIVAYLISRGRLPAIQQFVSAMKFSTNWRDAIYTAFGRSSDDLERQWEENLPRWIASGWKENLIAGFDLDPAKTQLAKGDYEGAKRSLESSQQLFTELKDSERQATVEALLSQCDTGIQAEALMLQVQQSLENHAYDRASTLLEQARGQYEQLPQEQRPDDLLNTYEAIANEGQEAGKTLDHAILLSQDWSNYPKARRAALDAGASYASLGDQEMADRSQSVLNHLQSRQRRLVLLLGALAVITLLWLFLWLWTRGPSELKWD